MAELFTSFDDAWRAFLAREEPLEAFFGEFPDDDTHVIEGWLVEPSSEIKAAAKEVQARLARFESLVAVPDHFLHVWIGSRERIDSGWLTWPGIAELEFSFERVNCFHTAVVVEVDGAARRLVEGTANDVPTFLPHLTIAVVREPSPPEPLRKVLTPLRGLRLGVQDVREVKLVRVPASKTTVLQPWRILDRVPLGLATEERGSESGL